MLRVGPEIDRAAGCASFVTEPQILSKERPT
jgi:hypothetical protein